MFFLFGYIKIVLFICYRLLVFDILKDFAKNWPAMSRWNPDYLKTVIGEKHKELLPVFISKDNINFLAKDKVNIQDMNFQQVIDHVFNNDMDSKQRIYLRGEIYPEIEEDIIWPQFLLDKNIDEQFSTRLSGIWVGTCGNITPLHYDLWHGVLVQVIGSKEVILFSPEDTEYLYPWDSLSPNPHTSKIDLRTIDKTKDKFPNYNESTPHRAILKPGEMLYIPPCWWHDVVSLDNCISVTCRWNISTYESVHPIAFK